MEPVITINGTLLTEAQAETLRVAAGTFLMDLRENGLGDDDHGKDTTALYLVHLRTIFSLMTVLEPRTDTERLDFLDRNMRMKMGWKVGIAPAGNVSVSSVIQPGGPTDIRSAIDAAMVAAEKENAK